MKRKLSLHQLQIFPVLAQHCNMTRAAAELNMTTPALSIQIKNLAQAIGAPLHEQVGRNLYLTDAGRIVEQAARDVLGRLDAMESELAEIQGLEQGTLKLSIITTAKYFVPRLLGEFCRAHAGINVALEIINREQCLERLRHNMDDLYVMGEVPDHLDVESVPFMDNPLVVFAPADHALAGQKNIPLSALADEPFIMRELGSGTRRNTEQFFQSHGLDVRPRMTLGSNEAVKQAVAGGLGIAVLSKHTLGLEEGAGAVTVLDVDGFPLLRQWSAIYPKGRKPSPATQAFLEHLAQASKT